VSRLAPPQVDSAIRDYESRGADPSESFLTTEPALPAGICLGSKSEAKSSQISPNSTSFRRRQTSPADIERLASYHRKALNLSLEDAIDIIAVLKIKLRSISPDARLVVVEDNDESVERGVLAYAKFDPLEVGIRKTIYRNAQAGEPQARIIVAHELAHVILHSQLKISRQLAPFRFATGSSKEKKEIVAKLDAAFEIEADRFAAAFLVPIWKINCMNVAQICETFGVTERMAQYRLALVDTIRDQLLNQPRSDA
jgi:Zn-dependent peptidase ImmA (M78 family)